jgi:hypothetical protein
MFHLILNLESVRPVQKAQLAGNAIGTVRKSSLASDHCVPERLQLRRITGAAPITVPNLPGRRMDRRPLQ